MSLEVTCACGETILKSYDGGKTKLRSRMVVFVDGERAVALCKGCGQEHKIPILLGEDSWPHHIVKTGRRRLAR